MVVRSMVMSDHKRTDSGIEIKALYGPEDLADWDRGMATSSPGQSGQPGSPHYDDLLPLWAEGKYFPLAYSPKKVEDVVQHRLRLLPKPAP